MWRAIKWVLGLAGAAVALLLVALVLDKAIHDGPYEEIRDAIWQVELGASMDGVSASVPFDPIRVIELPGTPSRRPEVIWYYDHHPVAAVIPHVVFDKESGRVIAIYVDDVRDRRAPVEH